MKTRWGRSGALAARIQASSRRTRVRAGLAGAGVVVLAAGSISVLSDDDSPGVDVAVAGSAGDAAPDTEPVTADDSGDPTTTSVLEPSTTTVTAGEVAPTTTTAAPPPTVAGTTQFVAAGYDPAISADGRFVVYTFDRADDSVDPTVHLRDTVSGSTELIASSAGDAPVKTSARGFGVSRDGRFVLIESVDGVLPGDDNTQPNVFVLDRTTNAVERVTVTSTGEPAFGTSPVMSPDGRYVAFLSHAPSLRPDAGVYVPQVFVRDRQARTTTLASVNGEGRAFETQIEPEISISADGRVVVFTGDTGEGSMQADGHIRNGYAVFAKDMHTGALERVSLEGEAIDAYSTRRAVSDDGRWVALIRDAAGARPVTSALVVRDRATGALVELAKTDRREGLGLVAISGDGRRVAFASNAGGLVPDDRNGTSDVFVVDIATRSVRRASQGTDGSESQSAITWGAITADGRSVYYLGDYNPQVGTGQIFVTQLSE